MFLFSNHRSLLAIIAYFAPAVVLASPLATLGIREEGLSRRGNPDHIFCGNAPAIIAGYPVTAADIRVPSQDSGPPQATTDKSGYFPYLWCGAGTSTYVFIDPIGNYGYNKGSDQPIFWTGLEGALNATQNAMAANAASDSDPSTGDGGIGGPQAWRIPINSTTAGDSGIASVEVYAQDANHQHLTWGIYSSALTILQDFVLAYPLYADAMYFQISDSHWSTVGKGYMGIVLSGSSKCYLKGSVAQGNQLPCALPSDYPDN